MPIVGKTTGYGTDVKQIVGLNNDVVGREHLSITLPHTDEVHLSAAGKYLGKILLLVVAEIHLQHKAFPIGISLGSHGIAFGSGNNTTELAIVNSRDRLHVTIYSRQARSKI